MTTPLLYSSVIFFMSCLVEGESPAELFQETTRINDGGSRPTRCTASPAHHVHPLLPALKPITLALRPLPLLYSVQLSQLPVHWAASPDCLKTYYPRLKASLVAVQYSQLPVHCTASPACIIGSFYCSLYSLLVLVAWKDQTDRKRCKILSSKQIDL